VKVALSSPDKVLFPETGLTKADLAVYYQRVSHALLPHVEGRPLTLARFPEGIDRYGWYQTNCKGHPPWIATKRVGTQDCCVLADEADLVWAANIGAIELHPLLALADDVDRPLVLALDLDPGQGADIVDCCRVALRARELLAETELEAFPKTSGAAGLHVYAPLEGTATYAETRPLARELARRLAEEDPDRVTDRMPIAERAGKVFVDWNQNGRTKSLVAPYSLRAFPWPTVSMPLTWDEVTRADPHALVFSPENAIARLEEAGDLFLAASGLAPSGTGRASSPGPAEATAESGRSPRRAGDRTRRSSSGRRSPGR
jgi:bifunctional non-homologous end joining protein LigD